MRSQNKGKGVVMKQCDLQNQLKEGAPKSSIVCMYADHSQNERCLLGLDCHYQLPQKTERNLLIEEAEKMLKSFPEEWVGTIDMMEKLIAELKKDGSNDAG